MEKKIFFLGVIFIFLTIKLAADQYKDQYKNELIKNVTNISNNVDSNGIDLFMSSITYSQEEKDKRFIGKMKIPISRYLILNLKLESTKISNNIGDVGFLSFLQDEKTLMNSDASFSVGITWSNYNNKFDKINYSKANDIRKTIIKNNEFHNYNRKKIESSSIPIRTFFKENLLRLQKKEINKFKSNQSNIIVIFLDNFDNQDNNLLRKRREILRGIQEKINSNYIFNLDDIKKFINEKISEKFKKDDFDLINSYCELSELIDSYNKKIEKEAIDLCVNNFDLYKNISAKDIPQNIFNEIKKNYEDILGNIAIFSFNVGINNSQVEYLNLQSDFEKQKESFTGINIQFKGGIIFKQKNLIGLTLEYKRKGELPKSTTIIQEYQIDGNPILPYTLQSKEVFLEGLKKSDLINIRFEYRKSVSKYFLINPFIYFSVNKKEFDKLSIVTDFIFSLDKNNSWIIGISPQINWEREVNEKFSLKKPQIGVGIYLSKVLSIGNF